MKFSVFFELPDRGETRPDAALHGLLEAAVEAETQGYHGVWFGEAPSSTHVSAAGLALAHLAARSERIRLGWQTTLGPDRHPLRLAEEVAMLDIMSGGRIDWAVACGRPDAPTMYADAEPPRAEARATERHERRFAEQLEIVLRAWTGRPFAHEGEFFRFPELRCLPPPVQRPHPPVWTLADSAWLLDWAAQHRFALLTGPAAPLASIRERTRRYRERAAGFAARPEGDELPLLRLLFVADSTERAWEAAAPALEAWRERWRGDPCAGGADEWSDDAASTRSRFEACAIVGDAVRCRDRLVELRERTGTDHVVVWPGFGRLPPETLVASQRRFIEKVVPALA